MGEGRLSGDRLSSNQRITVPEAAAELGITEAAVRGRIKRGTLRSYRESGTVYVLLEGGAPTTNRDAPTDKPTNQSELVAVLREQLEAEREANRENRRIIAALASRIPELEAPSEPREPPESAASDTAEPRSATEEQQEQTSRPQEERSWWRRMFGG
jgi:hypothetical protein